MQTIKITTITLILLLLSMVQFSYAQFDAGAGLRDNWLKLGPKSYHNNNLELQIGYTYQSIFKTYFKYTLVSDFENQDKITYSDGRTKTINRKLKDVTIMDLGVNFLYGDEDDHYVGLGYVLFDAGKLNTGTNESETNAKIDPINYLSFGMTWLFGEDNNIVLDTNYFRLSLSKTKTKVDGDTFDTRYYSFLTNVSLSYRF